MYEPPVFDPVSQLVLIEHLQSAGLYIKRMGPHWESAHRWHLEHPGDAYNFVPVDFLPKTAVCGARDRILQLYSLALDYNFVIVHPVQKTLVTLFKPLSWMCHEHAVYLPAFKAGIDKLLHLANHRKITEAFIHCKDRDIDVQFSTDDPTVVNLFASMRKIRASKTYKI